MKDFIEVNISPDHNCESGANILGRAGEGYTTTLKMAIPEALANYSAYLDFEKPNGEKVRTPKLEVRDGIAYYNVSPYILTEHGELKVQFVVQGSNGEIWKSSVKKYTIDKSLNAVDDIPDKEDFITDAQNLIDTLHQEKETFTAEAQKVIDELSQEVAEIAETLSNDSDFVNSVMIGISVAPWVNTISGNKLRFFVGTQEEYNALTDTNNLFAIITDDPTKDELFNGIEELRNNTEELSNGVEELRTNTEELSSGIEELRTNAEELSEELRTNTEELSSGIEELREGIDEMAKRHTADVDILDLPLGAMIVCEDKYQPTDPIFSTSKLYTYKYSSTGRLNGKIATLSIVNTWIEGTGNTAEELGGTWLNCGFCGSHSSGSSTMYYYLFQRIE